MADPAVLKIRPDRASRPRLARRRGVRWLVLAALLPIVCPTGCALFEVARQQQRLGQIVLISGTVSATTGRDAPLVVVIVSQTGEDEEVPERWEIVDYVVRERPGFFRVAVGKGRYRVGAYQDLNENLKYDSLEPTVGTASQPVLDLEWGDRVPEVDLVIRPGEGVATGMPIEVAEAAEAVAAREQLVTMRSLVVRGAVVPLGDDRFAAPSGSHGLWRPADFLGEVRPGIYFLEDYDPQRVPVLFVHGIGGYPQQFAPLIDALDRDRFQPWVYLYPSGVGLDGLGFSLAQLVLELRLRHGFRDLALVAHSMGGLVSRSALLHLEEQSARVPVRLFVSISSPFGGHGAAQAGADRADSLPENISIPDSFLDMAPRSRFLRDLFFLSEEQGILRPLPQPTEHHLIFGFRREPLRPGPSGDGTIALESQLRVEAQIQASTRYGIDADHTQILREPATAERVNALLNDAFE